jgi:hypothetical protein
VSVRGGPSSGDPRLVEAYEAMRCRHRCEGPYGAGYEVLTRQGLAAWIQAFSGCVGAVAPESRPPSSSSPSSLRATVGRETLGVGGWGVPVRLYPELTRLVAGLALGRTREGVC